MSYPLSEIGWETHAANQFCVRRLLASFDFRGQKVNPAEDLELLVEKM